VERLGPRLVSALAQEHAEVVERGGDALGATAPESALQGEGLAIEGFRRRAVAEALQDACKIALHLRRVGSVRGAQALQHGEGLPVQAFRLLQGALVLADEREGVQAVRHLDVLTPEDCDARLAGRLQVLLRRLEEARGLQVPVDGPRLVRVLDSLADLSEDLETLAGVEAVPIAVMPPSPMRWRSL
jgi:hypothetical protein